MSHWRQQVESFIRGRRWIVAHDVAQATAKGMQRVMDLGAQDVLGIATSMGTGDLAPHDPDKLVVLDVQGGGLRGVDSAQQLRSFAAGPAAVSPVDL